MRLERRNLISIFCSLFSAILIAMAFPPYSVWGLSFFAFIPFLLCLFAARSLKDVLISTLSMGIFIVFTGFYWVSEVAVNFGQLPWIVGKIVLCAFAVFGELQFTIFGISFFFINRYLLVKIKTKALSNIITLFTIPILYVAADFLYPKIFPNTLGHGLYAWFSLAQVAEVAGVFPLTFFIISMNGALALLIAKLFFSTHSQIRIHKQTSIIVGFIFFILIAMLVISDWGTKRINEIQGIQNQAEDNLKIAMVQGNIGDVEKIASELGSTNAIESILQKYKKMSLDAIHEFSPDLLVWPETAYPLLYTNGENAAANMSGTAKDLWMRDLTRQFGIYFAFGGYSREGKHEYNTIFMMNPDATQQEFYRKNILLAFGEYVPLGPFTPLVLDLIPSIADFARGTGPKIFEILKNGRQIRFAPQICYEGIIPEFTRETVSTGVDFMLNVTNDSWFGNSSEPWIHLWITAFRSIELRTPMIRSTNTGFSVWIDSSGKIRHRSTLFQPENIYFKLPILNDAEKSVIRSSQSFYAKHGEWFAKLISNLAIILLITAFLSRVKSA